MTKVYLLLRNNKQSGPHSLEELLKLDLKPLDLIWVEGKSFGWSYPSEITALKPYVAAVSDESKKQSSAQKVENQSSQQTNINAYMPAETQTPASVEPAPTRKVYVSLPSNLNKPSETKKQETKSVSSEQAGKSEQADKIEQKAEELRKRMQSYVPEQKPVAAAEEPTVTTKYSSTIPEREEAYTSWIYNQKVNKGNNFDLQKNWGSIVIAALLILVVGYGISQYHNDNKEVALTTSAPVTPDTSKQTPEPLITEPEAIAPPRPVTENNIAENNPDENKALAVSNEPVKTVVKKVSTPEKIPAKEAHKGNTVVADNKKTLVSNKPVQKETPVKNIVETKPAEVKALPKKEDEPVAVAVPKKKKTLNEKVDAFFSKFSRKKEATADPSAETSAPVSNTNTFPGTAERKAVHRDDKQVTATPPPVVSNTNLADYVQLTANKPAETWMLGIHGLKVSLHNTGSETVKTAEVELRYYTDQNEILEKKIVNFSNIAPGKTVTLPAPDHRLADHADYKLIIAK